jgi:hypothetical protein
LCPKNKAVLHVPQGKDSYVAMLFRHVWDVFTTKRIPKPQNSKSLFMLATVFIVRASQIVNTQSSNATADKSSAASKLLTPNWLRAGTRHLGARSSVTANDARILLFASPASLPNTKPDAGG